MGSSNDLAISGLLYGANYPEWRTRMDAKFRIYRCAIFAYQDRLPQNPEYSKEEWDKCSRSVARIIRVEITPALLQRIPNTDGMNAKRLMELVEELSLRFRFLDLPPELRIKIYEYVIDDSGPVTIRRSQNTEFGFPTVTKTTRLLREESRPIFYSRSTLQFSFVSTSSKADQKIDIAAAIRNWAINIPQSLLKLLRNVDIHLRLWSSNRGITFTIRLAFSEATGLYIGPTTSTKMPFSLSTQSRLRLSRHAKIVESNRKVFGMQGEAIILAILSDPNLWTYRTLDIV